MISNNMLYLIKKANV